VSTQTSTFGSIPTRVDAERGRRIRVFLAWVAAALLILGLSLYGADYYSLPRVDRPFSPKHPILRPSGLIGVNLGILGLVLFLIIFFYAIKKRIPWLAMRGNAKHWMDFHVVCGIAAPLIIAFHASFKFQGIAGMAFWIMLIVAVSGFVGRYIYSQIPRSLNAAEISLNELKDSEEQLTRELSSQKVFSAEDLERALHVPSMQETHAMGPLRAIMLMIAIDLGRPFHIAGLRNQASDWGGRIRSCFGLLETGNREVERIIQTARRKSSLSKRIVFLARTHQIFNLWHVIHRPFSYSFAVLAIFHIVVVLGLGFR